MNLLVRNAKKLVARCESLVKCVFPWSDGTVNAYRAAGKPVAKSFRITITRTRTEMWFAIAEQSRIQLSIISKRMRIDWKCNFNWTLWTRRFKLDRLIQILTHSKTSMLPNSESPVSAELKHDRLVRSNRSGNSDSTAVNWDEGEQQSPLNGCYLKELYKITWNEQFETSANDWDDVHYQTKLWTPSKAISYGERDDFAYPVNLSI